MNKTIQVEVQNPQQNKCALEIGRRVYTKPQLKCYGSVSSLTMSGSGLTFENGVPGNCSQNKNAKPCR